MNQFHVFQTAWRALAAHKLRSLLSSIGIVIAIAAVVAALAIGEGAKRETLAQLRQLGANNIIVQPVISSEGDTGGGEKRPAVLTSGDQRRLAANVPGARAAASLRRLPIGVTHQAAGELPLTVCAVTEDYFLTKSLHEREGRLFAPLDFQRKKAVCVLGAEAARRLGAQGKPGATVIAGQTPFQVVGVLQERRWEEGKTAALTGRNYNLSVFIPLGGAASTEPPGVTGASPVDEVSLLLRGQQETESAAAVVKRLLEKTHHTAGDFEVIVPEELIAQTQRTQRMFNLMLLSIALISLAVGGIGIFNIMMSSVAERTHEIGIRRSVGASQKQIARHFLAEAMLLTLSGGVLGVAAGAVLSVLAGSLLEWRVSITLWPVVIAFLIAIGTGIAAGLLPALRAARMNPVAALRNE